MTVKTTLLAHTRWMIRQDIPAALEIEAKSYDPPWTEEDFANAERCRNHIVFAAENGPGLLGFMVIELRKRSIHIIKLAVHPRYRRYEVGTQLIGKVKSKLHPERRRKAVIDVGESNLGAQLFLRSCGFLAGRVDRGEPEDTYHFVYEVKP